MSQLVVNLKEQTLDLASKRVKAYLKEDLAIDHEILESAKIGASYLWLLRECGTEMLNTNALSYTCTGAYRVLSYHQPTDIIKAYEITVVENDGVNPKGIIREIKDFASFREEILNEAVPSCTVEVVVTLKDGQVLDPLHLEIDEQSHVYYEVLRTLDLRDADVEEIEYLNYY